jgi:hypothetical protein
VSERPDHSFDVQCFGWASVEIKNSCDAAHD